MKKIIVWSLIALLSLSGCSTEKSSNQDSNSSNNVSSNEESANEDGKSNSDSMMNIAGYDVDTNLFRLYMLQYIYSYSILEEDVNELSYNNMISTVTEQIITELVEYKIATVTEGVEVSDEDLTKASDYAESFMTFFGQEFLGNYGISREYVDDLFTRQIYIEALKNKSLDDLSKDYMESYSEEYNDKTFFEIYYILVPTLQFDENGQVVTDESNNKLYISDEEKAEKYALAEEIYEKALANIEAGETDANLEELAEEYELSNYSTTEYNYYGAYADDELNKLVENLNEGDISEIVEAETGYMIVRMDDANAEEYKEFAIEYMAEQGAEGLYPTLEENWITASGESEKSADTSMIDLEDYKAMVKDMNDRNYSINATSN